jgi:hypothetical protein
MERTLQRNPQVVYRDLASGQGGVLLHLDTGSYHGVNEVGAAIWKLVDGGRTRAQVVRGLRELCDDAPAGLEADVDAFVDSLLARDLLR